MLNICDRLRTRLPEAEFVNQLRKNLRPHIRKEIVCLQINSVSQLRQLMLRRENLSKEIEEKNEMLNNRRQIHEIDSQDCIDELDEPFLENVSELRREKKNLNPCFNCKEIGHIYEDCLAPRTVFCYGCGLSNVYKPQCPKCSPSSSGNFHPSCSNNISLRSPPK